MSISADFGPDSPDQPSEYIASNRGWSDLCDWVASLDKDEYSRLVGLIDDGWDDELDLTIGDLKDAIKNDPPTGDVAHTADVLLAALVKHEGEGIVVITGGVTSGDSDDEDDDGDEDD